MTPSPRPRRPVSPSTRGHARPRRAAPAWLTPCAREALRRVPAAGFPTTRRRGVALHATSRPSPRRPSSWREPAHASDRRAARGARRGPPARPRLVFVNGRFAPTLSASRRLPAGVRSASLAAAHRAAGPASLERARRARRRRRACLRRAQHRVPRGRRVRPRAARARVVERPIHLHLRHRRRRHDQCVAPARADRRPGASSQSTRRSSYLRGGRRQRYLTNAVTEVVVGDGRVVEHYRVQRERRQAYHIAPPARPTRPRAARSLSHASRSAARSCATTSAPCWPARAPTRTLNGLYLADGTQLVDNHTTIDHAKPHCASHELYKGILDGQRGACSTAGSSSARTRRRPTPSRPTGRCCSRTTRTINTKPQLEIFADDVKCTHGATVGQLDEEAHVLPARARHRAEEARDMLIHAFAGDVLERRSRSRQLREQLERALFGAARRRDLASASRASRRRWPTTATRFDVGAVARGLPDPAPSRCTGSRSSTSTTRPPRRSRRR